ncbi:Protein CBG25546 [Caenorhabditis briggsae]|uniref:Protein CBG25546 n=1 Tax=Caenorhabditis briggsae TaxID=6238 RepID=B6IIR8_CAEBR|nr:Protein CBG25546 [Caenorhabditis briggsae]CAR99798.1 Protein CBG25546 [Caenorhabditis briggsae]
MVIGLESQI